MSIMKSMRSIAKKIELDRAVVFGILAKIWGIFAAPITTLVIVSKFTPDLQGYYYTFASILALQGFIDLGIGTAITQFASHEWARLTLDKDRQIVGDKDSLSRLISLAQIALKWFFISGIIVAFCLIIGGNIFFSRAHNTTIIWKMPWNILCLLTGINICLVPVWALLEGCNQVSNIYYYRLLQGMVSSVSIWISIILGAKLWTGTISISIGVVFIGHFICKDYKYFLKKLFCSAPEGPRINWLKNIVPFQWRMGLSGIGGYFVASFFTPVLFHYHGAVIAGQFGMTWGLISLIGAFSASWFFPKVPQLAILIAQQKFQELDHLFWRITKIVFIVTFIGVLLAWLAIYLLNAIKHPFAKRILSPLPAGIFLVAQFFSVVSFPFSFYLRAHKKEPLMYVSLSLGLLIMISNLTLGRYYSATGMAVGYLVSNVLLIPVVILIWQKCRMEWHYSNEPI